MNGLAVASSGALVLAAVLLVRDGATPRRRLVRMTSGRRRGRGGPIRSRGPEWRAQLPRRLAPPLVGLATATVVGGWVGLVAGALVGLGVARVVRKLPSPAVGRERDAAAAELPYAVDLLAAVLRSGAPLDGAVAAVATAVGGPLGKRLGEVGRALRLGVVGEAGWQALADVPGAEGFVPAAVRAADSGAALAAACGRCAAELRERREARAEAAAQRAGVWIVLPLGFCFLPAFVLVGVVPIVLGVLDDLLR